MLHWKWSLSLNDTMLPCHLQESMCSEMAKELRFALKCHGSSKKIRKAGSNDNRFPQTCVIDESEPTDTLPNGGVQLQAIHYQPNNHIRRDVSSRAAGSSGYLPVYNGEKEV